MKGQRGGTYERGQATVELALLLPLLVALSLAVIQVGMLTADRLAVIDAARVGARAAALRPERAAVDRAFADQGIDLREGSARLSGELRPGGVATITVRRPPTRLPVVGRALGNMEISETLVFRVEDPDGGPPP